MSRLVVAAGAVLVVAAASVGAATAQGTVQYDWGGDKEWGGKRQLVSISPQFKPGHLVVSFGDRRLYHVVSAGKAMSYPIAIPREQSRWQGATTVSQKRENPSWTPTGEMLRENPRLPLWVPGGHPMNPLGVRALYLGSSTYRIHGTDAPWTIGQAVSKGCIRMFNEDVIELYPKIPVGTAVTVTWQRFTTQAAADEMAAAPAAADEPSASRATAGDRKSQSRRYTRSTAVSDNTRRAAVE